MDENYGLSNDEVCGTVELWKIWSAGNWNSRKLIQTGVFESRKHRKQLMAMWSRKHILHFAHNYYWVVKLDEPPELLIRPPAEYTNTTPYGVAKEVNAN